MALPTAYTLEIAFTTAPFQTPTWVDVSAYMISAQSRRGRSAEMSRTDPGTFRVELDNSDRRFDPTYTSSPYYPNVIPMKRIRFRVTHNSTTYNVWTGFIEGWPPVWSMPDYSVVSLSCVDGFDFLNTYDLDGEFSEQFSGERINAVLTQVGWPAGDRSIDTGQSRVQAATFAATDEHKALDHIQNTGEQSELGVVYIGADGKLVFHDRHRRLKSPYSISQATFGDAAGELPYESADPDYDRSRIENLIRVTRPGGTTQTVSDSTSQTAYGKRVGAYTPALTSDIETKDMADFLLGSRKDPHYRFRGLTVQPLDDNTLWAQVLGRELGDRITVKKRPPGGGNVLSQDVHIESISHEVGPARQWHTSFTLSPAEPYFFWVLDVSELGDSEGVTSTRLAY